MKFFFLSLVLFAFGCHHAEKADPMALIQIQDRNGLTETISNPDRLVAYETTDFLSAQPYKKVLRVYKANGKNSSRITTYHANGTIWQYLEAEEMRAHGTYREWYPNGQLRLEATVIGGTADLNPGVQQDWVFDSLSRVWGEQGNLIAEIPYNKGVLEGKSTYYYPSGQIEKELSFEKNKLHGESIEFWPEGVLKSKINCENGLKEGPSLGFFENGNLSWTEDYAGGRLKEGTYYNLEDEVISEVKNGGGFQALYDETGLTLTEFRIGLPSGLVQKFTLYKELHKAFFLKNGKKQGEETEYFLSEDLEESRTQPLQKLSVTWNENMIHGPVKTWYDNGNLQSERQYARNQRSGPSLAWYRDGSLMLYEEYEEGRLVSGQYYKMQKSDPVSSVVNGNGLVTLYDEQGSFLRKVPYLKGKPIDPEN